MLISGLWAETNKSGANSGSIIFKIKNDAIWWDATEPQDHGFQTQVSPLVLRQQTDEEPAMASWSAIPTGWPDVALMLCFCKPVGRAFSDGGSPSLKKPWEEVGREPPRRVGGKGRTIGPGICQAVWGRCPELSLYLAVMLTECEKKGYKFSLSHKLCICTLFGLFSYFVLSICSRFVLYRWTNEYQKHFLNTFFVFLF